MRREINASQTGQRAVGLGMLLLAAGEAGLAGYALIESGKNRTPVCTSQAQTWLKLRVFFSLLLLLVLIFTMLQPRAIYAAVPLALALVIIDARILFLSCPVSMLVLGSATWPAWIGLILTLLLLFITGYRAWRVYGGSGIGTWRIRRRVRVSAAPTASPLTLAANGAAWPVFEEAELDEDVRTLYPQEEREISDEDNVSFTTGNDEDVGSTTPLDEISLA